MFILNGGITDEIGKLRDFQLQYIVGIAAIQLFAADDWLLYRFMCVAYMSVIYICTKIYSSAYK